MSEHISDTDFAPLFSHEHEGDAADGLMLYVDGELPAEHEPALFNHLATCEACRQSLDSVMAFRRLSRLETLTVPPAVDAKFMKRLHKKKKSMAKRIDRMQARRPLWTRPTAITVRTAVIVGMIVFFSGILVPGNQNHEPAIDEGYVFGYDEQLEIDAFEFDENEAPYHIVYWPGLTVEASLK